MFFNWIRNKSVSAQNGQWGEALAAALLCRKGYRIVGRNVRPFEKDRRLEIDLIALETSSKTIVFVEVKQSQTATPYPVRLRRVDRHKRDLLRRACRQWLRLNEWDGGYRFDVIEIYGSPNSHEAPLIDHIERVRLFTPQERFVNWAV